MSNMTYSEAQQAEFCALAQEIGIGRARTELKYPQSYATGIKWMNQRGIKPNVDKLMQQAKLWHVMYEAEDLMEQIDVALSKVQDLLITAETADDAKKLAEAMQKLVNTRLLLEGKATTITEKREQSDFDLGIKDLIAQQKAANALMKDDATHQ